MKNLFLRKRGCLRKCICVEIFHTTNVYDNIQHFDILSLRFRKKDTMQYFSSAFSTKTRLFGGLLPAMELLKNVSYNIRYEKC